MSFTTLCVYSDREADDTDSSVVMILFPDSDLPTGLLEAHGIILDSNDHSWSEQALECAYLIQTLADGARKAFKGIRLGVDEQYPDSWEEREIDFYEKWIDHVLDIDDKVPISIEDVERLVLIQSL